MAKISRRLLFNHVVDEFKGRDGIDLRKDPLALQRLLDVCEKIKRAQLGGRHRH